MHSYVAAAAAAGYSALPLQTRMKAPSHADAESGLLLLRRRCQSRLPTGCGLAVVCGHPRLGWGPEAGGKKVEGRGKIRGFGKVDRLEQRGVSHHQHHAYAIPWSQTRAIFERRGAH